MFEELLFSIPSGFYLTIAIAATVIFVIQTILTFIGVDTHGEIDLLHDSTLDVGGFASLFSVRSVVNFFLGFGWTGVILANDIQNKWILILLSIAVGLIFACMYGVIYKKLRRLEENGVVSLSDVIGLQGNVYLRIPGNNEGKGIVQVSVNNSIREYDAITYGNFLPTGTHVSIIGEEAGCLVVEKC